MRNFLAVLGIFWFATGSASAAMVADKVPYSLGGNNFEGILVYDDSVSGKRPAVLMAPNFMGVTENAVTKAKLLAGKKYVYFIVDIFGVNKRPKSYKEAVAAMGGLMKDVPAQRARANKALDVFLAEAGKRNLIDSGKTAAIGFCFGGANVLELARSGRDVRGVVSFHGSLSTPNPADARNIKAKVLVLHGAVDPVSPKAQRDALEAELTAAGVDYQIIAFSGAYHSFTNPEANAAKRSIYDAKVTKRAYAMMDDFFAEIF